MSTKCKSNKILCLRNVFPDTPFQSNIEDLQERRLMGHELINITTYTKIPPQFVSVDTWPKKTNLLCCWCSLSYNTPPIPYPRSIEKASSTVDNYTVDIDPYMQFHSFNCLVAYITDKSRDASERVNKICMANLLYKIFNKVSISYITPAINPLLMARYGGDLSEQEYMNIIDSSDKAFAKDVSENSFEILCKAYSAHAKSVESDSE